LLLKNSCFVEYNIVLRLPLMTEINMCHVTRKWQVRPETVNLQRVVADSEEIF